VADQLHARQFDEIQQRELDELERRPGRIRAQRIRAWKSDRGDLRPHKDLEPLDARIDEVRRLLGALRDRFFGDVNTQADPTWLLLSGRIARPAIDHQTPSRPSASPFFCEHHCPHCHRH
jgi:hypothetical protein